MGDTSQGQDFNSILAEVGAVDDKQSKAQTQQELLASMQKEIGNLKETIQSSKPAGDYQNIRSDRDQLVNRYAHAVNWIEQNGGKYDPATGQISVAKKDETPKLEDQVKQLENDLKTKRTELKKQLDDGDITQQQYMDKLDTETDTIRSKKYDLIAQQRVNQQLTETFSKQQEANTLEGQFKQIQNQYPDADNPTSDLFRAMNEIIAEDPTINMADVNYGQMDANGNVIEYTGNPQARKYLIERAMLRLEKQGKARTDQHQGNANRMTGMEQTGYTPPPPQHDGMDKGQVGMLVAEGFKSKSLLSDVNKAIQNYNTNGMITLEG